MSDTYWAIWNEHFKDASYPIREIKDKAKQYEAIIELLFKYAKFINVMEDDQLYIYNPNSGIWEDTGAVFSFHIYDPGQVDDTLACGPVLTISQLATQEIQKVVRLDRGGCQIRTGDEEYVPDIAPESCDSVVKGFTSFSQGENTQDEKLRHLFG